MLHDSISLGGAYNKNLGSVCSKFNMATWVGLNEVCSKIICWTMTILTFVTFAIWNNELVCYETRFGEMYPD